LAGPVVRKSNLKAAASGDGFVFDDAKAVRNHFNAGTMVLCGNRFVASGRASQSLGPEVAALARNVLVSGPFDRASVAALPLLIWVKLSLFGFHIFD
jgi:hypothetical protein